MDPKTLLDDEGHYDYGKDAFGDITASLTDNDVIKLLGEPNKKDERTMSEATGDVVQTWSYDDRGLTLGMFSTDMKGPQAIGTISVAKPSTLKTKLGIGIGSKRADAIAAYGAFKDKEMPDSPDSLIAGSVYGGLIIDFTDGVVSQMFMGAGAE